jgi:hypothetical protein
VTPGQSTNLEAVSALLRRRFPLRGGDVTLELSEIVEDGHAVWIRLRFARAGKEFAGSVRLMNLASLDDPRRDAFVQGWIDALEIVVREGVERISAASIDVRFPIDAGTGSMPASFRDDLLKGTWLGKHLKPERRTASAAFEKAPASHVLRDGKLNLDALLLWVQAHVNDWSRAEQTLAAIPEPARVLWFLFTFDGAVNNGGLAGFRQSDDWIIRGCRDALRAVGAQALLDMLESGDDVDSHEPGGSWFLLEHELKPRLTAYCMRRQADLIA